MASSFSRQRNPNMEKALFDWPIVLQYDVKEISRKFFGHEVCLPARSLSQPKPRCVCIRFIHQSNRSISVCLLFLFCSRVFISRSYENRSNVRPKRNFCKTGLKTKTAFEKERYSRTKHIVASILKSHNRILV